MESNLTPDQDCRPLIEKENETFSFQQKQSVNIRKEEALEYLEMLEEKWQRMFYYE